MHRKLHLASPVQGLGLRAAGLALFWWFGGFRVWGFRVLGFGFWGGGGGGGLGLSGVARDSALGLRVLCLPGLKPVPKGGLEECL